MTREPTPRTATTAWKNTRRKVINKARREGLEHCPNCNIQLIWEGPRQAASAEVDHITPYALGGSDHPDNLTILCNRCNTRKGDGTRQNRPGNNPRPGSNKTISTGNISYLWGPGGPLY